MRFDIYGRFRLEVVREAAGWQVYRVGDGTRRLDRDIVVPDDVAEADLERWLDDALHELGRPGSAIRRVG